MNRRTLHALIAIVVGLVLLLLVLQRTDRGDPATSGQLLLPDFRKVANDASEVRIVTPDDTEPVTITRSGESWVVAARDDYAADVGKLRQLIIALADAEILEEKTSDPEQYSQLGVDDPDDDGKGTKVLVSGPDFSYAVILGDRAQRSHRYARVAEQATSYLIDRNPDVPQAVDDWLLPDVMDVDSTRVRKVTITHADGETIVVEKSEQAQTDFDVEGIPEGRELSYATVGNGIAGALGTLSLADVRKAVDADPDSTVVVETWDGLRVTAEAVTEDETTWFSFAAEAVPSDTASETPEEGDESDSTGPDAASEAEELNGRLAGWQYTLADYKKNQLTRRWDDILKTADGE